MKHMLSRSFALALMLACAMTVIGLSDDGGGGNGGWVTAQVIPADGTTGLPALDVAPAAAPSFANTMTSTAMIDAPAVQEVAVDLLCSTSGGTSTMLAGYGIKHSMRAVGGSASGVADA